MLTHSATLYAAAVLIWGSTWFAIRFQLGEVAPEVSVAYRFALASALLLAYSALRGLPLRFTWREHGWMAAQGLLLFCVNYLVFYEASARLTSGLIAVVFSTIVLMNILNGALLLGRPVEARPVAAALLGLAGIALVFWPEVAAMGASGVVFTGVALSLAGTLVASWGNIASARNQRHGLPVIQSNAYGMAWGALIMAAWAALRGVPFDYDPAPAYTLSLLYLSVFGSVLAFGSYLTLLGRIGPERAAYATVLFPVVALALSTLFEGYRWTPAGLAGLALVLAGNLLVLAPGAWRIPRFARIRPTPTRPSRST